MTLTDAPPTATVFERVAAIIGELPPIGKDQRNEQQGFMFRGHDDVLNALNPLLAKHGVMCVPDVIDRATSERHTSSGKIMFEVSLHVRFTFFGSGGDSFSGSTWGEGTDMGDKATSKAMTMAFKSMLNQTFAISNKEAADPDAEAPEESARTQQSEPRAAAKSSPAQANGGGAQTTTSPGEGAATASSGEWVWPSGKHQGQTLAETPRSYVSWAATGHPKPETQQKCAAFLAGGGEAETLAALTEDEADGIPF